MQNKEAHCSIKHTGHLDLRLDIIGEETILHSAHPPVGLLGQAESQDLGPLAACLIFEMPNTYGVRQDTGQMSEEALVDSE